MSTWTVQDWVTFIGVASAALSGAYLTVVRPLLAQLKELIVALHENTGATNVSATALTTLKPVVEANTVATAAGTSDAPSSMTVNVTPSQPPA